MTIDLSKLPPPKVVEELDYETIRAESVDDFVARDPLFTALVESDPAIVSLEVSSYRELVMRARVNDAAKSVLLAFAVDEDLEHLAALKDIERLVVDPGDPEAVPPVPPTYESNDALRLRVALAPEGYSVAGPRAAYEFHARSASGEVADARATSPNPGEVLVAILGTAAGVPSAGALQDVDDALNADEVRPLTDSVTVQAATLVEYAISVSLYLYPGPESGPILAAAEARLGEYVTAQRRIGRDIRLSAIMAAAHVEGVQRVEVAAPAADIVISDTEASWCTGITVALGGTDE